MGYKISELTALGTTPAVGDLLPFVDISDTTQAATGSTKKMTVQEIADFMGEVNNKNILGYINSTIYF